MGNTCLRFARTARRGGGLAVVRLRTADAGRPVLDAALASWPPAGPSPAKGNPGPDPVAWIASVVPSREAALEAALSEAGWRPCQVRPDAPGLFPHALAAPGATGVDRWLAAYGAFHIARRRGGVVVVQAGTAVTADWVDRKGVFRGGAILPGPALWLGSLAGAERLSGSKHPSPRLDPERAACPAGDRTASAVAGGLAAGLPGAVASVAAALRRQAGAGGDRPVSVALTGGWAGSLLDAWKRGGWRSLAVRTAWIPDLVLLGLRLWAGRRGGAAVSPPPA